MSRLALVLAVLSLSLGGCAVYGGDYRQPGYSHYYERYPARVYYYDDDRHQQRWHRDRYQDRRHSHYAPGHDGRYRWHDDRQRQPQRYHHEQPRRQLHGYQPPRQGWEQRGRGGQTSWQRQGQAREYDRSRQLPRQRHSQRGEGTRGWRLAN